MGKRLGISSSPTAYILGESSKFFQFPVPVCRGRARRFYNFHSLSIKCVSGNLKCHSLCIEEEGDQYFRKSRELLRHLWETLARRNVLENFEIWKEAQKRHETCQKFYLKIYFNIRMSARYFKNNFRSISGKIFVVQILITMASSIIK